MEYSRRISNYSKRITISDLTHLMSMADPVAIDFKTLRIDIWCSMEKEFTELIRMNPRMILDLTVNQVDSCHGCVCGLLT